MNRRKTVECRLSRRRCAPFALVDRHDVIWFKLPAGPIVATASVRRVSYFHDLAGLTFGDALRSYADDIGAIPETYSGQTWRFATLILLGDVRAIDPLEIRKRDRRSWLVLDGPPRIQSHRNAYSMAFTPSGES